MILSKKTLANLIDEVHDPGLVKGLTHGFY